MQPALCTLIVAMAAPAICLADTRDLLPIRRDDPAGMVLYLDKASVVTDGALYRARFVFNFSAPRVTDDAARQSYRSVADYNRINCREETVASAGQDIYAGEMGSGKVLASFRVKADDLLFVDVATENSEAKLHSVCAK